MRPSGLLATFKSQENFVSALKALQRAGFNNLDTATPQEIEGLENLLGRPERSRLYSRMGFIGAVLGMSTGFLMQWFASVEHVPLDIGGRPLNSWPSFIPIVFILTILFSALFLTVTFFIDLELPWPSHPIFKTSLDLSSENFTILVTDQDPPFEPVKTLELLQRLKADQVEEIT